MIDIKGMRTPTEKEKMMIYRFLEPIYKKRILRLNLGFFLVLGCTLFIMLVAGNDGLLGIMCGTILMGCALYDRKKIKDNIKGIKKGCYLVQNAYVSKIKTVSERQQVDVVLFTLKNGEIVELAFPKGLFQIPKDHEVLIFCKKEEDMIWVLEYDK